MDNNLFPKMSVLEILMFLDEYQLLPDVIIKTFHLANSVDVVPEDESCTICLEKLKMEDVLQLSCLHFFHKSCVLEWLDLSSSCPICRRSQTEGMRSGT